MDHRETIYIVGQNTISELSNAVLGNVINKS